MLRRLIDRQRRSGESVQVLRSASMFPDADSRTAVSVSSPADHQMPQQFRMSKLRVINVVRFAEKVRNKHLRAA
jgi:hypothetical protein